MNPNVKHRIPTHPYTLQYPGRPIRWVLADHGPTVTVFFADGGTTRTPRIEEH